MGLAAHTKASDPEGDGPLRTCVVARTRLPPEQLIRFVLSPDGIVVPDLACRLPGRGVWVTCDRRSVTTALKSRAFSRSLKRAVEAPADLADLVERLLIRRAVDMLALANKAGRVTAGSTRVEAAIMSGTPTALIHAFDGSPDGAEKLDRQYRAMSRDAGTEPRVVTELSIDQLSLALGRSNVVHAALNSGGVTELFISEALRLRRFRAGASEQSASTRVPAGKSARKDQSNTGKV